MTERLHFHFLSCVGEGNGNPLQCFCLENPRDGGAWWAAVHGVAQSGTWLKRLSSSSMCSLMLSLSCIWLSGTPWTADHHHCRLLCPWTFPGKNIGVGWLFLLQRTFPTQGSKLHLLHHLHWQADSLPLSHLGSPNYILIKKNYKNKFSKMDMLNTCCRVQTKSS